MRALNSFILIFFLLTLQVKALAITIPPDDILKRCSESLSVFIQKIYEEKPDDRSKDPLITFFNDLVKARQKQLEEYHNGIGRLAPIDKSILQGPVTSSVEIRTKGFRGVVHESREINWQPMMGHKVEVKFPDESKAIEQIVSGVQYFNDFEVKATQIVISHSFANASLESFRHTGIFILQIPEAYDVITHPFRAPGADDIDPKATIKKLKAVLKNQLVRYSRAEGMVTFMYTHQGEGNPVSSGDVALLVRLEKEFPGIKFKIIVLPANDHGYVAFEIESI